MNRNTNIIITCSSILLFLVGIIHLIRLFYGWKVFIQETEIPLWVSLISTSIPIFLSYQLLKIRIKERVLEN